MEKTRKAFVVLAAAVTAGGAVGCASDSKSSDDARTVDAPAAVDTKVPGDAASTPEAKREDMAADTSQQDASGADASVLDAAADTSAGDAGGVDASGVDASVSEVAVDTRASGPRRVDASSLDAVVDVTAGEVMGVDGGAVDTTKSDSLVDTLESDVFLRMDATVFTPDAPGPLVMPAGTIYDVLTRAQLSQ